MGTGGYEYDRNQAQQAQKAAAEAEQRRLQHNRDWEARGAAERKHWVDKQYQSSSSAPATSSSGGYGSSSGYSGGGGGYSGGGGGGVNCDWGKIFMFLFFSGILSCLIVACISFGTTTSIVCTSGWSFPNFAGSGQAGFTIDATVVQCIRYDATQAAYCDSSCDSNDGGAKYAGPSFCNATTEKIHSIRTKTIVAVVLMCIGCGWTALWLVCSKCFQLDLCRRGRCRAVGFAVVPVLCCVGQVILAVLAMQEVNQYFFSFDSTPLCGNKISKTTNSGTSVSLSAGLGLAGLRCIVAGAALLTVSIIWSLCVTKGDTDDDYDGLN